MGANRLPWMVMIFIALWAGAACAQTDAPGGGAAQAPAATPAFTVPYYPPPTQMSLCGEPVPLRNEDAWERFDREFTIVVHSHAQVFLWLKRKERYFPSVEKWLRTKQLPDDLKYVAVAESDLLPVAQSPAGAVGPWQFIASTGKNYGLEQAPGIDERNDFEKSSESAFRYLADLHSMFPKWALAIAAYNCGENRVRDEVNRQKTDDYYNLKLPLETERYIFRILAIKAILSNPETYGYRLPIGASYPEKPVDKVNVTLPASLPIISASEAAGISYREFKQLNPAFISDSIPEGSFMLVVPRGKGKDFQDRLAAAAFRSEASQVLYTVKKGETLSGVAAMYNVSLQDLRSWNGIRDADIVHPGQVLKILRR